MTAVEISTFDVEKLTLAQHPYVRKIRYQREFFQRSLSCFTDEDSFFQPTAKSLTLIGQVIHVTMAIEYFLCGMFGPFVGYGPMSRLELGFVDMIWTRHSDTDINPTDFNPEHMSIELLSAMGSLSQAMELFGKTMDRAAAMFASKTPLAIATQQLPPNAIFDPEATLGDTLEMMNDHTAHHRGAIVMYGRLLGRSPKLPYFDLHDVIVKTQEILVAVR